MIEEIKTAISNDSLVIFVGAGMSMSLNFPSWTGLIQNILKNIEDDGPFNFKYHFNQGNNIDVFKTLNELEHHNYYSKVKESLYSEISSISIDESKLEKHQKLWKISDKIITTNYDKVLEKTKPNEIEVFSNGNEFQQSKSIKGEPFLYKIHGDITNPDTCIIFESDYKKLYEDNTSDLQTFKSFLLTKSILFIGFSLKDPYVVRQMEFLYDLYKGHNQEHYVLQTQKEDFSQYNVKSIQIKDWDDDFNRFLDDLIEVKNQLSQTTLNQTNEDDNVDISKITDMVVLEKMLEEKKQEFDSANENEKRRFSKEMHSISNRMQELFAQKLQFNFSHELPEHKEGELEQLFDTIFQSEKLSQQTIQKIEKIRDQYSKSYQWYQRSLLVSALACSLINHKKVDPKKIDLLVDFTNDSEDKVWQKAISYLFLTLNHLGNKWLRFGYLKPKLETLKTNSRIQEALRIIIISLQINAQNVSPINERIFENDYFRNNPFNYFTPFYKDNPSIEKVYEDDSIEDVENYIDFLYNIPLPDSFKYLLCYSEIKKKDKKAISDSKKEFISYALNIHVALKPFLNYINELLNFYQNYPSVEKEIDQKTSIIKFKNFKNHLLSVVEHHRAMGRQFTIQNEYGKAITHYQDLIKIDNNDLEALENLAQIYEKLENKEDEILKLRLRINNVDSKNHRNLNSLSEIYHRKKDYKKALNYIDKAISLRNDINEYYYNRALCLIEMDLNERALLDLDFAIKSEPNSHLYLIERARVKNLLNDDEGAIKDCNKAIELDKNNASYLALRAVIYNGMNKLEEALNDFDSSLKLIEKDGKLKLIAYNGKANILRKLGEIESAHKLIDEAMKTDSNYEYNYGSRAAIHSTEDMPEKFFEFLEKGLKLGLNPSEFDKDIKKKYKNDDRFKKLLSKYNQTLK